MTNRSTIFTRLFLITASLFATATTGAGARTLEVSASGSYTNLQPAAAAAQPGDTILFQGGTYAGGQAVSNLQGRADAWITIMAAPGQEVILQGGGNAWQLSDAAYVRIIGFIIQGQTGNGLNLDDAGTFDTPSHHIVIERCEWRGIDATGNNDQLKLSGIDSFAVRDCYFHDGSPGGSMIDMVGCHFGQFTGNRFERAGSNCIQAKGGTHHIIIERNSFIAGGGRALNIGGSTGLQFFRPQDATFESSFIAVYSNVFVGAEAPVAFVGTVNSVVANNTFYLPGKWAIRILQETTDSRFVQCGDNAFLNNIVVVGSVAANPTLNVGPNTRPTSFLFASNLWYNVDSGTWPGPNLPVAEANGIIGSDPLLAAPPDNLSIPASSPAVGRGFTITEPVLDYNGRPFRTARSIGAFEGAPASGVGNAAQPASRVWVRAMAREGRIAVEGTNGGDIDVALYDMRGERVLHGIADAQGIMEVGALPAGSYLCVVHSGTRLLATTLVRW